MALAAQLAKLAGGMVITVLALHDLEAHWRRGPARIDLSARDWRCSAMRQRAPRHQWECVEFRRREYAPAEGDPHAVHSDGKSVLGLQIGREQFWSLRDFSLSHKQ